MLLDVDQVSTGNELPAIAPNPTTGLVFVQYSKPLNIVVSGIDGKIILEKSLSKDIDVAPLANGVYLITLYDEEGRKLLTKKLVKE